MSHVRVSLASQPNGAMRPIVEIDGLKLPLGNFVNLTATGDFAKKTMLFGDVVVDLDRYVLDRTKRGQEHETHPYRLRVVGKIHDEHGTPRPVIMFTSKNGDTWDKLFFPAVRENAALGAAADWAIVSTLLGEWRLVSSLGEIRRLGEAFPNDKGCLEYINGVSGQVGEIVSTFNPRDILKVRRYRHTHTEEYGLEVIRVGGLLKRNFPERISYRKLHVRFKSATNIDDWKVVGCREDEVKPVTT